MRSPPADRSRRSRTSAGTPILVILET
jgi:hypothetical protein